MRKDSYERSLCVKSSEKSTERVLGSQRGSDSVKRKFVRILEEIGESTYSPLCTSMVLKEAIYKRVTSDADIPKFVFEDY